MLFPSKGLTCLDIAHRDTLEAEAICRHLKQGEQMLAMGYALMSNAKLLLLDEPSPVLSPKQFFRAHAQLKSNLSSVATQVKILIITKDSRFTSGSSGE